jgi:hypothetical protein
LVINEFMAANSSNAQDPQGQYDDWIEIYNYGREAVYVGGMYLTDDHSNPTKWKIPTTNPSQAVIPSQGYLLIWADNDTTDPGLHASFKLDADGEQIALFDSDGVTLIDSITFARQTADISYGRHPDGDEHMQQFVSASPGAENVGVYDGIVSPVEFSHERGFYDAPFSVTLATETDSAVIYYSLDGSEPYTDEGRASTGRIYSGPIRISSTTCLRIRAVRPGWKAAETQAQTYIFIADVITQSRQQALSAGYPTSWNGYDADYDMDRQVCTDAAYANLMEEALLSIPTVSVTTDKDNLFSPAEGIYVNTTSRGDQWERPASAEYFSRDDSKQFQINCGLRLQGGASRQPRKCPKHSLSLRFRSQWGPAKLDFPLFGDSPVERFDGIHLRGMFNNSWIHWNSGQRRRAQMIRDQWVRDSLLDMGEESAGRGIFVHLYINGMYWGVYNLHERPEASHYAAYYGGSSDALDALNGGSVRDGNMNSWNNMRSTVSSRDWDRIQQVLAVDNYIDWTIIQRFGSNNDLKGNGNWRAAGGGPENRPWRLYAWDSERVLEGVTEGAPGGTEDPPGLFNYLDDIEEFRVRFGDRLHKHLFNGGALTPGATATRWTRRADEIDLAIIAESARWGDYRRDSHSWSSGPYYLYTRNDFWLPEQQRLLDQYFPYRTTNVLNQYKSIGLYPNLDAPVFRVNGVAQHGGAISKNNMFSMTGTTGTIWYTLDGSDPRMATQSGHTEDAATTLVPESAIKRVLVPTSAVDANWKSGAGFDDATWRRCIGQPGGIGYERSSGYQQLITLDVEAQMYTKNSTCYIRAPFVSSDSPDDFDFLTLRIRRDDGFVAYLNGAEVARRNFTGTPRWNSSANGSTSDSIAAQFEDIDISAWLSYLRKGNNLLAIQGLNTSTTSSDFLISFELVAGKSPAAGGGSMSPGAIRYSGPITLAGSALVRARALRGTTWSALNEAAFAVGPVADNLRVTEIMYNPPDPNEEFVELTNAGAETIDLNLVSFTDGIDFTFPSLDLSPGEYVVVVRDKGVFEARHGGGVNIAGQYSGSLNNAGERISLQDAIGQTILNFRYGDGWRSITDGEGFSLTVKDPTTPDPAGWDEKDSWRASAYAGGSPGADDSGIIPDPGAVVINEVLAHSHDTASDWIELYNNTGTPVDISGWFLSDSRENLFKYEIAPGTTIGPDEYLLFHQDLHFGNINDPGSYEPFALSENGEKLYLSSAQNGILTGYRDVQDFGASATGVSLGRYYKPATGNYNFVAMDLPTPGAANAYPKVGPIVISEIMYHPTWLSGVSYTNEQYEYIELHNISAQPVTLYDYEKAVPWKFTDGIEFTFDADVPVTIGAGEYLLVVKNPTAFSWRYSSIPEQNIVGPYDSNLSNSGEKLQLSMPGDIDVDGERQYIRVDRVSYSDGSHPEDAPGSLDLWPTQPDGGGKSLRRKTPADYGNDPENWAAAPPSPGG